MSRDIPFVQRPRSQFSASRIPISELSTGMFGRNNPYEQLDSTYIFRNDSSLWTTFNDITPSEPFRTTPIEVVGCSLFEIFVGETHHWCIFRSCFSCILFRLQVGTSSTAQGGGGSFKKRKTIGEIGCCESRMSKQKH